jgi:hypothetical protein
MIVNGQSEQKRRVGVAENEFCWKVKQQILNTLERRLLVVGPKLIRLLNPETEEEMSRFTYYSIKEFNVNEPNKIFDFEYKDSVSGQYKKAIFKTKHCTEIQIHINDFLKEILKKHKVADPDEVLARYTKTADPSRLMPKRYSQDVTMKEKQRGYMHLQQQNQHQLTVPTTPPLSLASSSQSSRNYSLLIPQPPQSQQQQQQQQQQQHSSSFTSFTLPLPSQQSTKQSNLNPNPFHSSTQPQPISPTTDINANDTMQQ